MPFNRETSTDDFIDPFKTSRTKEEDGPKRERVLSLVDKLYKDGAIDVDKWMACGTLRNQIMMEMPPSEGVGSYGGSIKASSPSTKADRVGKRHTGYTIDPDGTIKYAGGRRSRSNERKAEDAIFAAVGLHTDEGERVVNPKHAQILIQIITHTENMPTLTQIAKELSDYYTGAKQLPPFATGYIQSWLGRLAQHYRLAK